MRSYLLIPSYLGVFSKSFKGASVSPICGWGANVRPLPLCLLVKEEAQRAGMLPVVVTRAYRAKVVSIARCERCGGVAATSGRLVAIVCERPAAAWDIEIV